jgi:hypothetical protein
LASRATYRGLSVAVMRFDRPAAAAQQSWLR